jgi:outer membrane protein assembly factor BamB
MVKKRCLLFCLFITLTFLVSQYSYSQDINWTHFRGSNLNGIAAKENIPLKWDESSIKWKTEIHGRGHSSPVVFDNQIWLTTATPEGKELYAVCADYQTGRIIHDIKVFSPENVFGKH